MHGIEIPDIKCVIYNPEGKIKVFTDNNRWVTLEQTEITPEIILESGFLPKKLYSKIKYILLNYNKIDTLDDDRLVYESEEVTKDMMITGFDSAIINNEEKLKAFVPSFIPIDSLEAGDKIYCYTENMSQTPGFIINFDTETTHHSNINYSIASFANYTDKIKYRYKIGDGAFTEWTEPYYPYEVQHGVIKPEQLSLGANILIVEMCNEDGSNLISQEIDDAIFVTNENPQIIIIEANSNSSRIHFKISDNDLDDSIQYQLLLVNSRYDEPVELTDWSKPLLQPIDVIEDIDTSKIAPDELNFIKIRYKDNLIDEPIEAQYHFIGKYENICFIDESGNYYSTDKGVEVTPFTNKIVAGMQPEISKIKLLNNSDKDLFNVRVSVEYIDKIEGANVLLSRASNPFIGTSQIKVVDKLPIDRTASFFISIDTQRSCEGICKFKLKVIADLE